MPSHKQYINEQETISILEWATKTLSPEEFLQFNQAQLANNELWANYEKDGIIIANPLYENYYSETFKQNIYIQVGTEYEIKDGVDFNSLPLHQDYISWITRFRTETNQ